MAGRAQGRSVPGRRHRRAWRGSRGRREEGLVNGQRGVCGRFVMRVAILGTGKMGGAIARRLNSEGHQLTLWNRTRERAEALGVGKVGATPAEAAENAEVVVSILTDADAVRAAYLGEGGAAKVARNQVFVDMSTAGPDISAEIA